MGQELVERLGHGLASAIASSKFNVAGGVSSIELGPGLVLSFASIPSPPGRDWRAKRSVENLAGRVAARHALREAGHPGFAQLEPTAQGGAAWPSGFTGSITHTEGLAAALASRGSGPVGVDLERANGVQRQALRVFCSKEQLEHLRCVSGAGRASLIFSAKESVFKALSPLSRPMTIREIEIRCEEISEPSGRFVGWHQYHPDTVVSGFFNESAGLVLTVALSPSDP